MSSLMKITIAKCVFYIWACKVGALEYIVVGVNEYYTRKSVEKFVSSHFGDVILAPIALAIRLAHALSFQPFQ